MMAQYWTVKQAHPDCLLFYRMGDFYELFFDDAEVASKILDIALTKRGKSEGTDIPMCGVPVHSHESYLARLIKAGHRIALCDQIETPDEARERAKKEGISAAKVLVKRDVIRIITPGTLTEDNLLDARCANYLACIAQSTNTPEYGLAWIDLSTGRFMAQSCTQPDLPSTLERIHPGEIIISDKMAQNEDLFDIFIPWQNTVTTQGQSLFEPSNAENCLKTLYGVETLDSFGAFSRHALTAAGTLVNYVTRTQKGNLPHISPLISVKKGSTMDIDAATRRNLEINLTLTGDRKGSLLHTIDRTMTGAGGRLLAERLASPSTDKNVINAQLDQVECLSTHHDIRDAIRVMLKSCPDMERALSRLTIGRGSPRDLASIRDGLDSCENLRGLMLSRQHLLAPLGYACDTLSFTPNETATLDRLKRALADNLPFMARDGGFIAPGYTPQLDEQRSLQTDSKRVMARMQTEYAGRTGIQTLKISHNSVLGYFIEVSAKYADKLMVGNGRPTNDNDLGQDNPFVHRQTLANVVRFTTPELSDLERRIAKASETALAIEMEIFNQLTNDITVIADNILDKAAAIATIDVAAALGVLAITEDLCRPVLTDTLEFTIEQGRHPVVEATLKRDHNQSFAANDCHLSEDNRLWLLTGPNMAGKSTFLRQNALITIMAQMGSFVPAKSATIGIVDKVFSRVGASDDLARGRSTFMVEMVETAAILNQSTEKSLVILDEIGRGTATFDGLSIAWATLEYLHDQVRCRGLFATHYHELTQLTTTLHRLSPHAMAVKEWKGDIIFLHEVIKGAADQSYGIHVAKLAGLPASVILRARQVLKQLQKSEVSGNLAKLADDLPLFSAVVTDAQNQHATDRTQAIINLVNDIDPDALSPREALDRLYQIKNLCQKE